MSAMLGNSSEDTAARKVIRPIKRFGPLYTETQYKDLKDPCICFDGTLWHIYGSGGDTFPEEWEISHATAPHIEGPWTEHPSVTLHGVYGPHVAAPSVMYDPEDKLFHMAVQKDFMSFEGNDAGVAYLVSADGQIFTKMRTILRPNHHNEVGLYDPHLSILKKQKYCVYAGVPDSFFMAQHGFAVPQPDVYLAKSTTDLWAGEWKRVKAILRHEDIAWHHNRREHPDYEWGIEGPQLVELPNGKILLNATCFIEEGRRGTRQRVFFALADKIEGPYISLGPVLTTQQTDILGGPVAGEWENGENGHASAIVCEDKLYLFYQARSQVISDPVQANMWRYGTAVYNLSDFD